MSQATAEGAIAPTQPARAGRRLHPLPVRIMHWINAAAMLIMITSGWGIYDDDVIIRGFHFSHFWRLGDWAAWSLNWHFAGMWFLGDQRTDLSDLRICQWTVSGEASADPARGGGADRR